MPAILEVAATKAELCYDPGMIASKSFRARPSLSSLRVSGIALVLVFTSGCDADKKAEPAKTAAATSATPATATPAVAEQAEPAAEEAEIAPASQFDDETFSVKMTPQGEYKVGEQGEVEVVLTAKAGFKCNTEYPYKFKTLASDGVKYPTEVLASDAVKIDKTVATMRVPFVAESVGDKAVQGTFQFSVCSEEKCLTEKRPLKLTVPVL
jgi:hypothetical protein